MTCLPPRREFAFFVLSSIIAAAMKFAPRVLFIVLVLALAAFTTLALAIAISNNQLAQVDNSIGSPSGHASVSNPMSPDIADIGSGLASSPAPSIAPTMAATSPPSPTTSAPIAPPTPPAISSAAYQQGMTLRRNGDYSHAADSFRAALAEKPDASTAREVQFRLGESLWLAGDMQNATTALNTLIAQSSKDSFAARAHYFLADILSRQKSYPQAIVQLRAYRAQTRSLMGEIDEQIGDILQQSGNAGAALTQYNLASQDATMTAEQKADLFEKIAEVQSNLGHPDLAAARLGDAYAIAPNDQARADAEYRWGLALDNAGQSDAAISHWKHALAAFPGQDGGYQSLVELLNRDVPVDDFQRGLADYYAKSYDMATAAFDRYIASNPKNGAAAWYYEGLAYFDHGQNLSAVKAFDSLLRNFPKDRHAPDALFIKARAHDRASQTDTAVATYNQFTATYPGDSRADLSLWKAGQSLDTDGRHAEARAQYDKLATLYPGSSLTATSLFSIGFDDYMSGDVASATARWKTVAKLFPNSVDGDRALFWLGKVANAAGDGKSAKNYWNQAATAPRSYYSWRALDLSAPSDYAPSYNVADYSMGSEPNEQAKFEQWLANWTSGGPVSAKLPAAVLNDFYFRHGSELAQVDQAGEARNDFEKVNTRFQSDARSLYALAEYYQENNYFDLSIRAALQIQALSGVTADEQLPHYLRSMIYPTYYADLIVPYARRNDVDPAVLFALIRQESTFNPLANSWVGASGLTQVMPSTGTGIANDLGVRGFRQSDLLKPFVSIRFGAYFFGNLLQYFDGNVMYALGGYNGGPGNAQKWERPDVDVAVELIDLPESSLYVHTVYSQYNQYLEIYRSR